jgi:hypothetical protein
MCMCGRVCMVVVVEAGGRQGRRLPDNTQQKRSREENSCGERGEYMRTVDWPQQWCRACIIQT